MIWERPVVKVIVLVVAMVSAGPLQCLALCVTAPCPSEDLPPAPVVEHMAPAPACHEASESPSQPAHGGDEDAPCEPSQPDAQIPFSVSFITAKQSQDCQVQALPQAAPILTLAFVGEPSRLNTPLSTTSFALLSQASVVLRN